METISLKALSNKVLQRNRQGNSMETLSKNEGNFQGIFKGKSFPVSDGVSGQFPLEENLSVSSWLEKLSDSERAIYNERAAIMEFDGGLPREHAEVLAIQRIIQKRIIPGKCNKCFKVAGCMMLPAHRRLCEVIKR